MNGRLHGQTAWVGGGASGIGEATARLFAAEGARVAVADVQEERGRDLERDIRAAGGEAVFLPCDVAREEQVRDALDQTAARLGGLQILVNCAGIVHVKPLHDYAAEEWDRLMAVNVKSIFLSIKHGLAHLCKNPRSYMVNVGSISSFVGQAGTPAYTTSKFAVLGLSRSIALDCAADGLRCNCVCPGITDTPMLRHHLEATGDPAAALAKRLHRVPLGRALTPDDVARSVLYFSCEDSAGVTGTSLIVDGGYLAAAEWERPDVTLPGGPGMKLRLACADFTFPLLSHSQSLRLISLLGFDGVDVGLFEGRSHRWPSREFQDVDRSARELKRETDGLGLEVADVFLQTAPDFVPYAINHPEAPPRKVARDWFLKTLDYAAGCGCRHVTTLPGVHFEEETYEASFARSAEELAWRVEQAAGRKIVFGVEAHVGSLAPEPEAAARLIRAAPGLTLTLDYTHFTRAGLPDAAVEPLLLHASHFHVRGAREGRLQAPFTDNVIDYARVLDQMKQIGYGGWFGVEYVWIDWEHCNECDNVSETILFRDHLRSLAGKAAGA